MTEAASFFEKPILNSPYEEPKRHHALDSDGQPLNEPPRDGRRKSEFITPVPKPRKKKQRADTRQGNLGLQSGDGVSTEAQEYNPTPIINEIRGHLALWRAVPPASWGVTPATARLLQHWRNYPFQGMRPFFCQLEAVETVIWLTEVAQKKRQYGRIWEHILGANEQANPELLRIAMKMATGAGKTTVMAMLIAWQTVNAVRSPTSNQFARGFLVIAPGITIKDRLRVLLPNDLDSYYRSRELVPGDMIDDINKAKIVITNYHGLQIREILEVNKVGRSLLQGRHDPIVTKETEGQMVRRVAEELMGLKNIVVINDEAHHCYREKPDNDDLEDLKGDEKSEVQKENEAARLWINGIESFKRKLGVPRVRKRKARRPQHRDEDLCVPPFAGQPVDDDRNPVARVIDEQAFAGGMRLAHRHRQTLFPCPEEIAKPGIAVAAGMERDVFFPEDRQRDVLALQLAMDASPVRLRMAAMTGFDAGTGEQPLFQLGVGQIGSQRPGNARGLAPAKRQSHRRRYHPNPPRDLARRHPGVLQPHAVAHMAHRHPLHRH